MSLLRENIELKNTKQLEDAALKFIHHPNTKFFNDSYVMLII